MVLVIVPVIATYKIAHWPPVWHTFRLVEPAVKPLTVKVLPLMVAEATAELLLEEIE